MTQKTPLAFAIGLALAPAFATAADAASQLDTLVVEGESHPAPTTHYTSPSTRITDIEVESFSATTVEDFVKFEPSIVVRKRYIGDFNGTIGMRGSNMFQTTRTLVYADGLPLHYLLQTQYNGAPRWSLAAPDETQAVEVIYGPFSAEYSGNAMGGVINIETRLPQEREFHAEAGYFVQDYDHLGTDESFEGHREFVSYGDKFDDLSLYLFHNRLENESHPQSVRFNASQALAGGETPITGAYAGLSSTGGAIINYGDSGSEDVTTELTKLKLGYELGEWLARLTLAYEDRDKETDPNNFVVDGAGNPFWNGNASFNGRRVNVRRSHFAVSDQERETLLVGLGLEGPMGASGWTLDADLSYFDVMEDETRASDENPADPIYDRSGSVTEFDDTGWETFDLKARTDRFLGRDDMNFVAGYHFEHYSLEIHDFDSDDHTSGTKTARDQSIGGDTLTHAVFAQWGWQFAPAWDVALGARYERWKMEDGFYYKWGGDMEDYQDRTERGFSPKFSLGFKPDNPWQFRYSLAKAHRFPIVEELYKNEETIDGTVIADSSLEQEIGVHQNLMIERELGDGFARVNLYHEKIDDVIFNQTITLPDASTETSFFPIDEVTTWGTEFVLQQNRVFKTDLDVRFNLAYTDSEVTKNDGNPAVEGNDFPRIPDWRANLILTYHINPMLDASAAVRYAADSFGLLDNSDQTDEVMSAIDGYTVVDLKANYRPTRDSRIGFGVDNVNNEKAFVAHPWPQRTFYLEGSIDF